MLVFKDRKGGLVMSNLAKGLTAALVVMLFIVLSHIVARNDRWLSREMAKRGSAEQAQAAAEYDARQK